MAGRFQMPDTAGIQDRATRIAIQRMAQQLQALTDPDSDDRAATVNDMISAGVVGKDRGMLYSVAGVETVTPPAESGTYVGSGGTMAFTFGAASQGAVGTHALGTLPQGAIITLAWYNCTTGFTSAASTATIQLGIDTDDADGIKPAAAINDAGAPWAAGYHSGVPDGSDPATYTTQTTAPRSVVATVGVQALTGGQLQLFVSYVLAGG